jgi:predicted anti-sigma-YlaC factor YlaD
MNCRQCQSALPDLLLDPAASSTAAARAHLASCAACKEQFESLEATFALLDTWTAPEPSPYFDQKLAVRLREEQALAPAGWFERLRTRLLFNTGRQLRPALAGALALILLVGGGTIADLSTFSAQPSIEASATVQDLQILDKNDQALQTMDQLVQDDGTVDDGATAPPSS